jgi:NAD(P)-dependent dehydrogenase (short-subunit alcohol dehydrogenase family)
MILEPNLNRTQRACRIFSAHTRKHRYLRIINIASHESLVSLYEVTAYNARNAAVASFTKSLAIEWALSGVCPNAIAVHCNFQPCTWGFWHRSESPAPWDGPRSRILAAYLHAALRTARRTFRRSGVSRFRNAVTFVSGYLLVVDGGFLQRGKSVSDEHDSKSVSVSNEKYHELSAE